MKRKLRTRIQRNTSGLVYWNWTCYWC